MRPIERGPVPVLPNGKNKTVKDYKDWRADLIDRLGPYCCYCNMKLNDSPQVEHVAPKSLVPAQLLAWNNMLLACGPCNSIKNNSLCTAAIHFLPDVHNTHMAFAHALRPHKKLPGSIAGVIIPRPNPGLNTAQELKALATISLCGLNRVEQTAAQRRRASDLRWRSRFEAVELAKRYRTEWDTLPWATLPAGFGARFLTYLQDIMREKGFFSIWFDAFHNVPVVKEAIIKTFPNTAACFTTLTFDPIPRIPGDL